MKILSQAQWLHLYRRAGFGADWQDLYRLKDQDSEQETERLVKKAKEKPSLITVLEGESPSFEDLKAMDKETRKDLVKKARKAVFLLNVAWLKEMVNTENPLREKAALFWHSHFACKQRNVYHAQVQLHTFRQHALGSFRELLHAMAKDAAMIVFLNNQQNKKDSPNENFARELLELFSLGRGHYTEQDIKEAARAFTGWGVNGDNFVFRKGQHDFGSKVFLGKTGNFSGEEIIDLILEKPACADFITRKILRFFVGEDLAPDLTSELSRLFYQSDYDIGLLMQQIFKANWFYDEKIQASLIKSPIELLAGMMRQLKLTFEQDAALIFIQKILGQTLFDPPNVAGWKGGQAWIDSSTLMFRLRLGDIVLNAADIDIEEKEDDDAQNDQTKVNLNNLKARIDLESLQKNTQNTSILDTYQTLESYLSVKKTNFKADEIIAVFGLQEIQEITAWFTTLPEYQLC